MFTHDPYMVKAVEYLLGISFLLLFVVFWRLVNGEAAPRAERVKAAKPWTGQLSEWFRLPERVFFHPGHAWAKPEGGAVIAVGLDDFAQQLVGPFRGVELPKRGARVEAGRPAWSLRADSKTVDMLSPVSGTVVAVNGALATHPELANDDPYGRGWLLKVRVPSADGAVAPLMPHHEAVKWIERASGDLLHSMSPELGHLCQDGGVPVHGFARGIDEDHWDAVARRFLLTEPQKTTEDDGKNGFTTEEHRETQKQIT